MAARNANKKPLLPPARAITRTGAASYKRRKAWNGIVWSPPKVKLQAVIALHAMEQPARDALFRDEKTKHKPWLVTGRTLRWWYTQYAACGFNEQVALCRLRDLGSPYKCPQDAIQVIVRQLQDNAMSTEGANIDAIKLQKIVEKTVAERAQSSGVNDHSEAARISKSTMSRLKAVLSDAGISLHATQYKIIQ